MKIEELSQHISKSIQGMFGPKDMAVLKTEIEKLKPGDVYLEIGVDEGRSMAVAHYYAKEGVFIVGVDLHDVPPVSPHTIGRGPFAEQEGIIGWQKRGIFVHGDADVFWQLWMETIDLLFIDGGHSYGEVKENTLHWEGFVPSGGVILFHDIDHPETRKWVDEHYGKNGYEDLHGKIGKVTVK